MIFHHHTLLPVLLPLLVGMGCALAPVFQLTRFMAPRNPLLAGRLRTRRLRLRLDGLRTVTVAITFVVRLLVTKEVNTTVLKGLLFLRLVIQRVLEVVGVGVVGVVVGDGCRVPPVLEGENGVVSRQ